MNGVGKHILIDLFECNESILNDSELLEELLVSEAKNWGCTVLGVQTKQFDPHGVTCLVLVAESHLAVHTWPEFRFAALDVFTCGETVNAEALARSIEQKFGATKRLEKRHWRGLEFR